ncbi:formate dehydrogenase accessory protein [Planctomycetes bacterium Pan216]|uniref:Sulfur carrier protein FdhD n=1 Tax=Kolteria novifilia TaxID=2527975 RepID=A0A518AYB8_9BACT|nr:formate dehydrogenase accessory protein [Planctomycetes bacterium Pan216]
MTRRDQPLHQDASVISEIVQLSESARTPTTDRLAVEEPLEIRLGPEPLAVTMRTPGDDAELAAGFCLTEGIITSPDDLEQIEACSEAEHGNVIVVTLPDDVLQRRAEQVEKARRELYLSSSCGLCGKASLDRIAQDVPPLRGDFQVRGELLASLPQRMREAQRTFEETGGLHAAALFRPEGELLVLREDVGRHNAVDKVIGAMLLAGMVPVDPAILLVSGRASFEIMQKAALAGICCVAAISAPSSLAVEFARRFGMSLVGFLRPGRMNIYHETGRIVDETGLSNTSFFAGR